MVILHRWNKILCVMLLCFLFFSCNKYKEYNLKEISDIRNNAISVSKSIIGEQEYWQIYNQMNDSIETWVDNKLGNHAYWNSAINNSVDSVLCINLSQNKIITSLLLRCVKEECKSDQIQYFYGVKINEQWYFFSGPTMHLPRELYQKDIHTPLTFEKLRQIATNNIYREYLRKKGWDKWEINDNFFSTFKKDAYNYPFTTQEAWEESWLQLCRENWSRGNVSN